MWRNTDIAELVGWMREHNTDVTEPGDTLGFYGLDLYNMSGAMAAVLAYLDEVDADAAKAARERYACLTPWQKEPSAYGRAVHTSSYRACEKAVVEQCRLLLQRQVDYAAQDSDSFLDAAQSARLIAAASWNLRDTHMFETLQHLLEARGPNSKAVVWAHNSHVGDARYTEMGIVREELNIGQLCREHFDTEVALVGFGTHTGTVAAASQWDGDLEIKHVRPSHSDSYEWICHEAGVDRFLIDFGKSEILRSRLKKSRLERFIGVIYQPESERLSHYAEASLSQQFDAYVWFDETTAVTPIDGEEQRAGVPPIYPFGL